jgi:putative FmdB family regulatory protein
MPIYEYQCQKCQHELEALQKFSDKPLRECPECGKHSLKRLLSAPMFRLAGSGWYETDFKSDKETKRNLAGRDEAPAESSAPSTDKTESKPEKAEKPAAKPVESKPVAKSSAAKSRPRSAKAPSRPAARKAPARKPAARRR